jgi:uncharacterized protein YcbX
VITVARISIAPVKALALVFPPEVDLTRDGVAGDRRFWLCDGAGRLVNNKRLGALALIRPSWDEHGRELALAFPDGRVVSAVVELGEEFEATLYGSPFPSRPVLGPWDAALSGFAGEPVRLLWAPTGATDRGGRGGTVSLVSRASLRRLGDACREAGPLDGRRFRMLLEIDGVDPHDEDDWIGRRLRVGEAEIRIRGDVGRCLVTSQNPDTGVTDVDTLGALARYRRTGHDEPLPFGVYGAVLRPGRIRIGDGVTVEASAGLAPQADGHEAHSSEEPARVAAAKPTEAPT